MTATSLGADTRFETKLAGQDVYAGVAEYEPMTRIAWTGYPKAAPDSIAYHAWILTPTATGTHLWTKETMRGQFWVDLAKPARHILANS